MNPLLQSPNFTSNNSVIDISGNSDLSKNKMKQISSVPCDVRSWLRHCQLLLSLFDIEGVVHYGITGNANPSLNIVEMEGRKTEGVSGQKQRFMKHIYFLNILTPRRKTSIVSRKLYYV
ncbi:hypothetical protein DVH24_020853 [Malus domestica]|uniref:Uncharacterized protein n=1 Tax=Malus domestica TaxID=3750 RepID=A0A498J8M5_MALDO|nr:hypothetical protein DVH24_020853 [Malus domestica]